MGQCYWPELKTYCGLCKLSTGIYIKSVLNVIVVIIFITLNLLLLIDMVNFGRYIYSYDDGGLAEKLSMDDHDLQNLKTLYMTFTVFYLVWIIIKLAYIIITVCTVWAIYKQKPTMLNVFLYINVPNCIFDLVITLLVDDYLKVLLCFIVLTEVYNLLAIRSEFKRMAGKSGFIQNINSEINTTTLPTFVSPPHQEIILSYPSMNQIRYRNCTCFLAPMLENIPITSQPQSADTLENLTVPTSLQGQAPPPYDNKELNFKEENIIYNQNQLVEQQSPVVDYNINLNGAHSSSTTAVAARPNSLPLRITGMEEKKVDISELPVIYDESQLNVGSSPVIEDRTTRNASLVE